MKMATLGTSVSSGVVTVTGAAYSAGQVVGLIVTYAATDARRRMVEQLRVVADGAGAISSTFPHPFSAGTIIVKTVNSTGTLLATATTLNV